MTANKSARRVVITGLGALSPLGHSVKDTWRSLCAGESGGGLITKFDASGFAARIACELKGFEPLDHFPRKMIHRMDRLSLYALKAVKEAWEDSGLNEFSIRNPGRAGVIWASGNGGVESIEGALLENDTDRPRFSPYLIPRILIDTPSGMIALEYGLKGINYCPVSACASSNTAFMDAFQYIRWNKADFMVAGGSEAPITRMNIGGFGAMKALSTRNESPAEASRPLDAYRDGFVMGEGAGALILEEFEHARRRGAPVYAEIIGTGMSNDAYHATSSHPEGEGAALAIQMALEEAGIHAADIDYVNLHATGTPAGDLGELKALAGLIPQNKRHEVYISATKGATGHLLGAAGALEGVISVMSLKHGTIPPTINTDTPDPDLPAGFNYVWQEAKACSGLEYVLSNNFGFGGHNAVVLFRRCN